MITDLKHKVNKEVLLRNVEIVEQAISTYLNLKTKKDAKSELEEVATYIDSRTIRLPVGDNLLPCFNENEELLDRIKKVKSKDPINVYKHYLLGCYNTFVKNFNDFLEQNFVEKASDKEFIKNVKNALNNNSIESDFYSKIKEKYDSLVGWQERREEFFNDPDAYSYWRHDNLPRREEDNRTQW